MLRGFEKYTEELTDRERSYLFPAFCTVLKERAVNTPVSNTTIRRLIFSKTGYKLAPERLRKFVQTARKMDELFKEHVICSSGDGYFLTSDMKIVEDSLKHIESRINAQIETRDALMRKMRFIIDNRTRKTDPQKTIF